MRPASLATARSPSMAVTELPADARGTRLLALARAGVAAALRLPVGGAGVRASAGDESWLAAPGACFVTLTVGGRLRGCIGSVRPRRTLGADVLANAGAAAVGDPRFPPLRPEEWEGLRIEVSLLSRLELLPPAASEAAAAAALHTGSDGLVLEHGGRSATFLPQVWQQIPETEHFLAALKQKAGLPAEFWPRGIRLYRYTVEHWRED
jgi:AmmeMemoRadiSam system protein A